MLHNLKLQDKYLELVQALEQVEDLIWDMELEENDDPLANEVIRSLRHYVIKLEQEMDNRESVAEISFSELVG